MSYQQMLLDPDRKSALQSGRRRKSKGLPTPQFEMIGKIFHLETEYEWGNWDLQIKDYFIFSSEISQIETDHISDSPLGKEVSFKA